MVGDSSVYHDNTQMAFLIRLVVVISLSRTK